MSVAAAVGCTEAQYWCTPASSQGALGCSGSVGLVICSWQYVLGPGHVFGACTQ